MSRSYAIAGGMFFGNERNVLPVTEIVVEVARQLWPIKTARNLASRAGVSHRAAEFWLHNKAGMSADALANVLRSDCGRHVMEALMEDSGASWWSEARVSMAFADLERRASENRKQIEELRREIATARAR